MGLLEYSIPVTLYVMSVLAAFYSYSSIRDKTKNTFKWHILQWSSYLFAIISGFLFGLWCGSKFTYHYLGWIIGLSSLCILIYVSFLQVLIPKIFEKEEG